MLRDVSSWRVVAPLSLFLLTGCNAIGGLTAPSLPLPTYSVGDRFTFDNGQTDYVTAVAGDLVAWRRSNGYRWTASRDFVAPPRSWESRTRTGTLDSSSTAFGYGVLWPLRPGASVWLSFANRVRWKDGSDERTYSYRWNCNARDQETVTVPAGTFEAVPISCYRYAGGSNAFYGERVWYYAPRVGHYVLYIDRPTSRDASTKALRSYRLKLPMLTREQSALYNDELQKTLRTVRSGTTHGAAGAGMRFSITPVRTYRDSGGRYCREYRRTISMAGRDYGAHGTSCLLDDKKWHPRPRPTRK